MINTYKNGKILHKLQKDLCNIINKVINNINNKKCIII